jgi:hypothetical protein
MQDLANETALALGQATSQEALASALERERLIADISRRVRSELDLDAVLSVAVSEVGRALDLSRAFIRLGSSARNRRSRRNGTPPDSRRSARPRIDSRPPISRPASGGRSWWRTP